MNQPGISARVKDIEKRWGESLVAHRRDAYISGCWHGAAAMLAFLLCVKAAITYFGL